MDRCRGLPEIPSYSFIPDPYMVDDTGPGGLQIDQEKEATKPGFRHCSLNILKGELLPDRKLCFPEGSLSPTSKQTQQNLLNLPNGKAVPGQALAEANKSYRF